MTRKPQAPASAPASTPVFGQRRPSVDRGHSQSSPLYAGSKGQPLPAPTGPAPFRIDLASVIPEAVARMKQAGGMALHMVGDTGGVKDPVPQELVADGLEIDAGQAGPVGVPAFFFHLGDVIYFDGEAGEYFPQFYQPYEHYPNPIFAIPGNHDGDRFDRGVLVNQEPSLAPFVRQFCAAAPGHVTAEAREAPRTAMTQPNVYFTLNTPFATFVGLYTNVPEGGTVDAAQQDWFQGELAAADTDLPLVVAMHHPVHSLDTHHSGSKTMARVLAAAVDGSGRQPDIVFAAHVHNYQRFTITGDDGRITPFVVAGNGGYHNLHKMARDNGQDIATPYRAPDEPNVYLESYVDDRFGFLRLEFTPGIIDLRFITVPRPQEPRTRGNRLFDRMRYDWRRRTILV